MKSFSRLSVLALASLPVLSPATLQAQKPQAGQVVCFSFDGNAKLSGKDNTGADSRTAARVGGQTFFVGQAGSSPAQCASDLLGQLRAVGYTASKSAANVVCVAAGKGGTPLTRGGSIGSTDTGLDGIDCSVHRPPLIPNQAPPAKRLKTQGVTVPQVPPGAQVRVTHTLTIELEIERVVQGQRVTVRIQVQVQLRAGWSAQVANQAIAQALRRAGLLPQYAVVWSEVLQAPVPSWALDYHRDGSPVQHVILWQPQQADLIPMVLSAGAMPRSGSAAYGSSSGSCTPGLHQGIRGMPRLGGNLGLIIEQGPAHGTAFPALGFGAFEMPLFGGDLLIDPTQLLLLPPQPVSPYGSAGFGLFIPQAPNLVGLEFFTQWLVVDPQGQGSCLSNGLRTRIDR